MKSFEDQASELIRLKKLYCNCKPSIIEIEVRIKTLIEAGDYILTARSMELSMYNEIKRTLTKLRKSIK